MVYVDSGSSDDSVAFARSKQVSVVELDTSIPFSAGRARNEGFRALLSAAPDLHYVQFVDGDCRLEADWIAKAADFLSANPQCAVVCGRRKEINPETSIYNSLCDVEWDTPIGQAMACGGDFLARAEAFREVGGFDPTVIAGEEPEMCFRLREKGWQIWRIDQLMTWHDAQMTRLRQFWLRAKRCGHAYAQGEAMHGDSPEQYYRREVKSAIIWGLLVPLAMLFAAIFTLAGGTPWVMVVWLAPMVLYAKMLKYSRQYKRLDFITAHWYSLAVVAAKVPELIGIITYKLRARKNDALTIIEYK